MKNIKTDRTLHIEVGGGAVMTVPLGEWMWKLRYAKEPDRGPTICNDRMIAAGVCDSYLYLIQECTKEEAWRRIKIMREAINALEHPSPNPQ